MSSPISATSSNRAGLCPHGLPPAACPICSGGGMAGGVRAKEVTRPANNEWSYAKCVAVGLQMQAQKAMAESPKQVLERQLEFAKQLGKEINSIIDKIQTNLQNFQNSLTVNLQGPMQTIVKFVINPVLNLVAQIPKIMEKLAHFQHNAKEFVQHVAEKLVAVLGEVKNFIEKKITDKLKKKVKSILSLFIPEFDGENYHNDEELAVFKARELRKNLLKIIKLTRKRDNDDTRHTEGKAV